VTPPPPAPELPGYRHVYSGKVRDLYAPLDDDSRLLVVATDRISAYDHVLPTLIPDKGRVLNQLSLWWFDQLTDVVPNHLVDAPVPDVVVGRAVLVQRLQMYEVECVARGYLAGSGWAEYRDTGEVCGVPLPAGLQEGSRLPEPIFTPATKAELGEHDLNISFDVLAERIGSEPAGQLRALTLEIYRRAEQVARDRGIVLADTKLEFGLDAAGHTVLGDEVLTPDSSRFWPAASWAPGRAQPSYDKQYVRDWLTSPASGWRQGSDVLPPPLPAEVVKATRERYVEAYERLTGRTFV
jgi:phosphoribosylaminoimidazole-succinocarboxamide synthase